MNEQKQDDQKEPTLAEREAAARSDRIVRLVGLVEYAIAINVMIVVVMVAYAAGSVPWCFLGAVGLVAACIGMFLEIDLP